MASGQYSVCVSRLAIQNAFDPLLVVVANGKKFRTVYPSIDNKIRSNRANGRVLVASPFKPNGWRSIRNHEELDSSKLCKNQINYVGAVQD
jgi:hypothetical protein